MHVVPRTTKYKYKESDKVITQSNENSVLTSGNPLLNYRSMQFPSMSSDGLNAIEYPILGGTNMKHKSVRVSTSYEIASVKELCNMLTPIERTNVVTAADPLETVSYVNYGRQLNPFGWMNRSGKDPVWFCFLYQIMALYRYVRGSVQFALETDRGYAATANMVKLNRNLMLS